MKEPIIIRAQSSWTKAYVRELIEFKDVLFMLTLRDIKLRYRQTFLGVIWVILQPLFTSLVFTVIFGKFARLPSDGVPYLLFAFCGLTPWMFFSVALQRASISLMLDERLITKIYFPRVYIPLSSCLGVFIDFFVSLFFMIALMVIMHVPFTAHLLIFPFLFLVLLTFTCGLSLFFAAANVYYRDFKHMLPFMIQIMMYASPIVYAASLIPEKYQMLYSINPFVGIINGFRWMFIGNQSFPWISLSYSTFWAFLVLTLGLIFFRRIERYFADVI